MAATCPLNSGSDRTDAGMVACMEGGVVSVPGDEPSTDTHTLSLLLNHTTVSRELSPMCPVMCSLLPAFRAARRSALSRSAYQSAMGLKTGTATVTAPTKGVEGECESLMTGPATSSPFLRAVLVASKAERLTVRREGVPRLESAYSAANPKYSDVLEGTTVAELGGTHCSKGGGEGAGMAGVLQIARCLSRSPTALPSLPWTSEMALESLGMP
mmetsp:Transcript_36699/g.85696  ORF Transcript_36699/g.85696 Transcript_36699/m.85696 type:complete len:214 (-) Transcript_36699:2373-3014(-)